MKKIIFIFTCLFLLYSLYSDYINKMNIRNNYIKLESNVKKLKSDNKTLINVIREDVKRDSLIIKDKENKDTIFIKITNPDLKVKLYKEDTLLIGNVVSSELNRDSCKIVIVNSPQQEHKKRKKLFKP